jgi:hypothetical protein
MVNRHERGCPGLAALCVLVVMTLAARGAVAAEVLDALRGRWALAPGAPPTMEWQPDRTGFTLTWGVPGAARIGARFEPSARPGIYAGHDTGKWSMFGGDAPVNPLVEGTLLWARTTADAAYVYSLTVDDRGDFVLDRYTCRPSADTLSVAVLRWTAKGPQSDGEQQLVRVDR